MQTIAVIRLQEGRLAWYSPGSGEDPQWLDDEVTRQRLHTAQAQRRLVPRFAVPGADVRLLQLELTAAEKKHIGKSLPFMLEEQVAADIEDLHFASRPTAGAGLAVAICGRDKMDDWTSLLASCPGIKQWVPEPLLLPWREGEWCLVLDEDKAIVRTGECEGFTIEVDMVTPLLTGALQEGADPRAVVVYGADQAADTRLLPEAVRERVQWRQGNLHSALMLSDGGEPPLNLLQGDYAPRLPFTTWWRHWRAVAMLFALAFGLQLLATYADYLSLEREHTALRSAVQESYRRAYPRGAVVDAEKQLRRQLDALRGSGQSSGFVSLVEQVGMVIAARPGTTIDSINYNDKGDEMRMNIVAANYEAVEQVREDINRAGLQAVMESSNAQGDRVRARLRVGRQS